MGQILYFKVLFRFSPLRTFNRYFALTRRIDWLTMSDTESEGSKGEGNTLGVRHDINKQFVNRDTHIHGR